MVQTPQVTSGNPRRTLWIQFLAFAVIVLLIYLKPKVEAWVESQSKPSTTDVTSSSDVERPADPDVSASLPDDGHVSTGGAGTDPSTEAATKVAPASKSETTSKRKSKKQPPKSSESDTPADGGAVPESDVAVADTSVKSPKPTTSKTSADEKPVKEDSSSGNSNEVTNAKTGGTGEKSVTANSSPKANSEPAGKSSSTTKDSSTTKKSSTQKSSTGSSITKIDRSSTQPKQVPGDSEKNIPPPKSKPATNQPELGKLKEVRNNVFESSAGLIYRSGSEDGHRLKHVMQHAKDNPEKPKHGVFDGEGDRDIVLAIIDEAFLKAKQGGPDVRTENQNDRLVYTVNLKRRIGHSGGQEGERKGFPECRYLRIVLEDDNVVISAFPTRTF